MCVEHMQPFDFSVDLEVVDRGEEESASVVCGRVVDSVEGSSAHVWRIACPAAAGKGLGRIPKDFFYDKNVPSKTCPSPCYE